MLMLYELLMSLSIVDHRKCQEDFIQQRERTLIIGTCSNIGININMNTAKIL